MDQKQVKFPRVCSLRIEGFRPFGQFEAPFSELEVIVGANGSGKSSLFEFLKFLRDAVRYDIPPEIVPGSIGQEIFHRPGPERFYWNVAVDLGELETINYQGQVLGPVGKLQVVKERAIATRPESRQLQGYARRPNQLALNLMTNPNSNRLLFSLREFIVGWRFFSAFNINNSRIRSPVPVEQEPILQEDGGNLSAVLFYLLSEHPSIFDELRTHIRSAVPGFRNLTVKARGGPGTVIATWEEIGVQGELSLADLSDGILRFLCWTTLCLMPNPPTLICIDEPDQGVHPRTLPVLAGLFEKASTRTQLLLATHASYFLTQFDISRIAVMKKVNGESQYLKPADSKALRANLNDFGVAELEAMHRSDELEILA